MRHIMLSAAYLPSFDKAMDKLKLQASKKDVPEWGLALCRPGEMLEITVKRVMPKREIKLVRLGRTWQDVKAERSKRMHKK